MTTQPEALRLADALNTFHNPHDKQAAAELRRLHEAHEWQYTMAGQRLRRIEKLEASNHELLEALEGVAWMSRCGQLDEFIGEPWLNAVHAAIAKAERTTT